MATESMALLEVLATVVFVAYLGMMLWYAVALLVLRARRTVARGVLTWGYALLGSLIAGLALLALAPTSGSIEVNWTGAIVGAVLLVLPGFACAFLGAKRRLPPGLNTLAWPLAACAVLLVPCFGFSIWVAMRVRQIEAYNNPNLAMVRAALAKNPNDAPAHMSLAHIAIGRGDYAQAAPELQAVVRLEPDNREAAYLLAHALMRTGQPNEAWAIYARLAAQDDGWGRAARRYLARHTSAAPPSAPGAGHAGLSR